MNRTLKSFSVIVIVCWCCLSVTPAGAMIVFDNGTPSKSGGFLSDNDGGVRFADDFVFAAPEVFNGIRFWGFYSPTDTPPLNDVFTAVFYGNAAGLPDGGNVLATRVIGNPGRTDTGDDIDGAPVDIYVYEAQFPEISLGAGHYWVSIYNNTSGDMDDNWAWARHTFPGNDARSLNSGATWIHEFSDSELAFQLIVPEPGTMVLMIVALGGLGVLCGRVSRRA